MLSGKANQRIASSTIPRQAERSTRARAAGKSASAANPTRMRTKVTPFGPIARSPSAMNKNDAPQMIPGPARRSQSEGAAAGGADGRGASVADGATVRDCSARLRFMIDSLLG